MIGRTLGNYHIVEQIGMGGMATVYKAYDPDTDRYVAVKILPHHFSQDPTFHERFQREAKVIAGLEHIHILPIFAYGEDGDIAYMAMRYLQAGTLTNRIKQGPLPFNEASRLLGQIAGALDYAHTNGVLHRDVKPSNVLLDADGNAFLTDFGIAKMVEATLDLTGGGILGTPAYMSPEQCRGSKELTPTSDIYSLGIILYEMVTGRTPFQAETPIALIHMQLHDPLPPPSYLRPDLPESAERVIFKALAKDPNSRYKTCGTMAAVFAQAVAYIPAKPPQPLVTDVTTLDQALAAPTSSPFDEVTIPHKPVKVTAVAPGQRGLPGRAIGLIGILAVIGLIAGALFAGLIPFGQEISSTDIEQASDTPAPVIKEDDNFWNFEGEDARNWTLDTRGWWVVEVEDGHALEAHIQKTQNKPYWAYLRNRPVYDDFHLSFQFKLVAGNAVVTFRDSVAASKCFFYNLSLHHDSLQLEKGSGPCGPPNLILDDVPARLAYNTWHLVEIIADGDELTLMVDGQEAVRVVDSEPLPPGTFTFGGGMPGSNFYIDDVRINPIASEREK